MVILLRFLYFQKDSWMDVTSHNVGLPALEVRKSECSGYLLKCGRTTKTWQKRYCILKDACIYYYKNMYSPRAQGNCRQLIESCDHIVGVLVKGARHECGRSWVQAPIGSNQRLSNLYLLLLR